MTFGWRHVGSIVAIAVISSAALFTFSIWRTNSQSRTRRLDRVMLPVLSGDAFGHAGYTVLEGSCAVPAAELFIDPKPVSRQVLSKLSSELQWQPISEMMKSGDVVHYYTRHYKEALLPSASGGILVMRGQCLVGIYAYWGYIS